MITIKDIAKKAGVAQGTVSNVLNNKGNVSSEKIKRVMDAANELGYIHNSHAALLRKGESNCLAVIMPNSRSRQYQNFFSGFKTYATMHGFDVKQFLTNENHPKSELDAFLATKSYQPSATACFSCFPSNTPHYLDTLDFSEIPNLMFVEHRSVTCSSYIGFDYQKAGMDLGEKVIQQNHHNIVLLTGNTSFSSELDFCNGFLKAVSKSPINITHIQTDSQRKYQNIMQAFNGPLPDGFVISNYGFAESVKDIYSTFYQTSSQIPLYTVSPLFTMPENDFIKYELNYWLLGKICAKQLIHQIDTKKSENTKETIIDNVGFRNWNAYIKTSKGKKPLNILTLDSPEAYTMRNLSQLYTKETGIDINICILSYEEIYEAFNTLNTSSNFDILRLDVTWLSWFAEKILVPLRTLDPNIQSLLDHFLPGSPEHYSYVHGELYALPSTPSVQILYYQKELFENPIYKRMYFEQYKHELLPPTTFEEMNCLARFFTKHYNPFSPVDFGSTLTLGSTGVSGSEFLARLFSHQDHLYDKNLEIHLDSDTCIQSLCELIELKKYSSPTYCNWWTNTAKSFASGNCAMSLLYSNYATDLLGHHSSIVGNIGYSMVPGCNPVIGGGSLGVSKFSKQQDLALSYIKWFCSEPISSAGTLLGSTSPCKGTYNNLQVVDNFPWLDLVKKCFTITNGNRIPPQLSAPFDERQFLSIVGMAVKNSYNNICSPKDALIQAQKQLETKFQIKY